MIENREFPRFAMALECRVLLGGIVVPGRSKDISRSGISCVLEQPLELSALVDLEMSLAFGDNAYSEPLKLPAMVVWCTTVADGHQVGAKFVDMTPELKRLLEVFIEYLEG